MIGQIAFAMDDTLTCFDTGCRETGVYVPGHVWPTYSGGFRSQEFCGQTAKLVKVLGDDGKFIAWIAGGSAVATEC